MPAFGDRSKDELAGVHPHLRMVLDEAIRHVDFTVIQGHRGEPAQNEAFRTGKSTLSYPKSKHNVVAVAADVEDGHAANVGAPLSRAVDIAPWHPDPPHIRWERSGEFYMLGGLIRGIGEMVLPEGWTIRLGADWDRDGYTSDQSFHDLGHVELVEIGVG